ncbi:alpha-amylase family glycosyl hydrolase [Maribacter sp. 2307ULW6-5]|uniref:alpha-amylase family glycosyl hydrolase n=1 Tax=Maribacter sp. 2307ULW6-5 TaxID=3386275 RepID=UPI0039BCAE6C
MQKMLFSALFFLFLFSCKTEKKETQKVVAPAVETTEEAAPTTPFVWEGANIYFLLTDRFHNGNPENDLNYDRSKETGVLRGFMGGDIAGITQKIEEGYFTDLGINAIWFTPVVEQVHGSTDEGTGNTYAYHGYWTKDWTALDPNFGTRQDLERLVDTAHDKGIRVILDVVLNHTGPVTEKDAVWPEEWVITDPTCEFTTYENTTNCTLVDNLPDILTATDTPVDLPDALLAKWKEEGRLSEELEELQLFFDRTGYPRAPRFYIIKWLTDYIHELGVDGFRVDTVKHVNENAWQELQTQANYAFETWKKKHPKKVLDNTPFYMMGEVYNYGISGGREFDFGDKKVDYFDHGFNSLINFELKYDAKNDYERIFTKYDELLNSKLEGKGVVNYLTSHDDGAPFDKERKASLRTANVLLLTPGTSQVYYGDETARNLIVEGTQGDATLRSFMNWEELENDPKTQEVLRHWQKLGTFRSSHPAVGAGRHQRLSKAPYVFSRTFIKEGVSDRVVVGLDLPEGEKTLSVKGVFENGTAVHDAYSNTPLTVENGKVVLNSPYTVALLEAKEPESQM